MCLLFISLFGNRSKRTAREWIFFFIKFHSPFLIPTVYVLTTISALNSSESDYSLFHSLLKANVSVELFYSWKLSLLIFVGCVLFSPQKNRLLLSSITLTRKRMAWPRYRIPFNFQDGMSESMTRESLHGDSVYGLSHTWRQFLLFCSF